MKPHRRLAEAVSRAAAASSTSVPRFACSVAGCPLPGSIRMGSTWQCREHAGKLPIAHAAITRQAQLDIAHPNVAPKPAPSPLVAAMRLKLRSFREPGEEG